MGKYMAYKVYEDAHNEFVNELPQGWVLSKFKYEIDYVEGPGILANDFHEAGIPLLRIQNVKGRFTSGDIKTYLDPQKVKDKWEHFKTKTGDLLISGSASTDLVTEVTEQYEGAVPYTGLIRLRAKKDRTDKNYVRYFVQSELFKNQIDNLKTGSTIQHFGPIHLQQIVYPSAMISEQTQIANFLDHETAKIDTLIDKQQQLIKLLKEKRQAVISHAVTKGLNPDAPMKDSGVEWLGEVPEHWVVSKFGYISQVVRGGSPRPAGDPTLFNGDYSPWVTVAEITKDDEIYLTETETFLTKKGSEQCRVFSSGTLLLSNSGATLGVPSILKIDANANDGVVGFENLQINSEFAYFYLSTLTEDLRESIKQGSGQPNLNTDIVKDISVPVPPLDEVEQIISSIIKLRDDYSRLIIKATLAIKLMQERRTALISSAVTGKIDVRNWKAPVSQEAQHQEAS